jgi:hypothetical protein
MGLYLGEMFLGTSALVSLLHAEHEFSFYMAWRTDTSIQLSGRLWDMVSLCGILW